VGVRAVATRSTASLAGTRQRSATQLAAGQLVDVLLTVAMPIGLSIDARRRPVRHMTDVTKAATGPSSSSSGASSSWSCGVPS
jgi:hypothetical protein